MSPPAATPGQPPSRACHPPRCPLLPRWLGPPRYSASTPENFIGMWTLSNPTVPEEWALSVAISNLVPSCQTSMAFPFAFTVHGLPSRMTSGAMNTRAITRFPLSLSLLA